MHLSHTAEQVAVVVALAHQPVVILTAQMVQWLSLVMVEMVIQTTFSEPNIFGQVAAAVGALDIRQIFIVQVMVDEAVVAAEVPLENK